MSSEIMKCSVEGPTAEEIKTFVDSKYAEKSQWAGVKLECAKELPDVPVRKLYFDLKTGWGATGDDPRTLHSFEKALAILEKDNFIQYIVYIPDDEDDADEVAEMNRKLCPIEMKVCSQPTRWEIENVDVVNYDGFVELSEDMAPIELVVYAVELSNDLDHVVTIRGFDLEGLTSFVRDMGYVPPFNLSEAWIEEKVTAAMAGRDRIILCDKDGYKTSFSRETGKCSDGSSEETIYVIERFGRY